MSDTETFVFIPRDRSKSIAADLLKAADSIKGVDRKTAVRTVRGGYNVLSTVAEKYRESGGDVPETEESTEEPTEESTEESTEIADGEGDKTEVPDSNWTVAELEDWASKQDPAVDLGGGNKASKLKAALDSIPAE